MSAPPGVVIEPIRLDHNGDFFVDGLEVTHPRVLAAMRSGLQRGQGGWSTSLMGGARAVDIEDTAYFVRSVREVRETGAVELILTDDTVVDLSEGPLWISDENVLYANVRGESARFLRPAQRQLEPYLKTRAGVSEPGASPYVLEVGGRGIDILVRVEKPGERSQESSRQ